MASSDLIRVPDYNDIRDIISQVMANGSGTYGYGQALNANAVAVGNFITKAQWDALRYDIINALLHQTGSIPNIAIAQIGDDIVFGDQQPNRQYSDLAVVARNNRFEIGSNQYSVESLASRTQDVTFNVTLQTIVTVSFNDANRARWFFNSGGKIRLNSDFEDTLGTAQSYSWTVLTSNTGTPAFGAGTSPVGFYSLTNQNQLFFTYSQGGLYNQNSWRILVRSDIANNSNGGATQIIFTVQWVDSYADLMDVGPGDQVNGRMRLNVSMFKPTGILYPGQAAGSFTVLPPSSTTISEFEANFSLPYPVIRSFDAIPNPAEFGAPATLQWRTRNSIYTWIEDIGTVPNSGPFSSQSGQISVSEPFTKTFTLHASNSLGEVTSNRILTINPAPVPRYVLSVSPQDYVDEGDTVTFTLRTENVSNGTVVPYTLSGVSSSDIGGSSLTGSFTVNNGSASVTYNISNDQTSESRETLTMTLGGNLGLPVSIKINDTSQTPVVIPAPTIIITANVDSVITNSPIVFTITTTNATLVYSNGTNLSSVTTLKNISSTVPIGEVIERSSTAGSFQYVVTATGPGGTTTATRAFTVTNPILPTYSITPSSNSVNEGNSISWVISTNNFGSGTLYYTNSGSTDPNDFIDGSNSGVVAVTGNNGSFSKTLRNDLSTEGNETIIMQLRTGSTSGPVVATATPVSVNDTSVSLATYSITPSSNSVNEGNSISWVISTNNFGSGTLYYTNSGSTDPNDFIDGSNSGSINMVNNSGSFSKTLRNDLSTEGSETIIMQLRTGSTSGPVVATATPVSVNDTSVYSPPPPPLPTYQLRANVGTVNEGGHSVLITLTTTEVSSGTSVPWTISGSGININDFSIMQVNGSVITKTLSGNFVMQNGASTLKVFIDGDRVTEGSEVFTISLNNRQASVSVTIADTSTPITVNELVLQAGSPAVYSGTSASIDIDPEVLALAVLCVGAGGSGGPTTDPGQAPAYGAGGGAGGWVASTYFIQDRPVVPGPGGKRHLWDQTSVPGWVNAYSRVPSVSYSQMIASDSTQYATVVNGQVAVNFSSGATMYGSTNNIYLRGLNGATGSSGSQSGGIRAGGAGGTYLSQVPSAPDMAGIGRSGENNYTSTTTRDFFGQYVILNTPLAKGAQGLIANLPVPQDVSAADNLNTYGYGAGGGGRFRSNTSVSTGAPGAIYVWKFVAP